MIVRKVRIEIDPEANAAYVRIKKAKISKTKTLPYGQVNVDLDKKGDIVGIELIGVKLDCVTVLPLKRKDRTRGPVGFKSNEKQFWEWFRAS